MIYCNLYYSTLEMIESSCAKLKWISIQFISFPILFSSRETETETEIEIENNKYTKQRKTTILIPLEISSHHDKNNNDFSK